MSDVNTTTVTLPTGKEAVIQELTGRSENILANETFAKQGKTTTKLLQQLVVTIDGQSPTEKELASLFTADRRALLLATRIASLGSEMVFERQCMNQRCNHVNEITLDLETDIEWTPMPEEVEVEVRLPASGKIAKVGPLTGEAESILARSDSESFVTNQLLLYLRSVEGLSTAQHRPWLNDASVRDTAALRKASEDVEFGPETQIEFQCTNCDTKQRAEVTSEVRFFFPAT